MINQATANLIGAILALSGSILLWALGNFATNQREARSRSDELRKRFLEKQIEEFYGPLLAISQRRDAISDIRQKLIMAFEPDKDKSARIRSFIRKNYYEKLNHEMEDILTRKLHLLEDTEMPSSFRTFLIHAIQADLQYKLWREEQIDNRIFEGNAFSKYVFCGYSAAILPSHV